MNTENTGRCPGPWSIRDYSSASSRTGYAIISPILGGSQIAGVTSNVFDARLIAAAPDLLAACLDMVTRNMGQPSGVAVPALDAMRAAIDKATGGERIVYPEDDPAVTYAGDGDGSHSPYCECYQCAEVEE